MEKLDLVILLENSSWTIKSFIDAGGSQLEKKIESGFREMNVDFRVACVKYGDLSTTNDNNIPSTSKGFSSNVSDIGLHQNAVKEVVNSDGFTMAIEETCGLDWRADAKKICFILTDTPPNILSQERETVLDIFKEFFHGNALYNRRSLYHLD